MSPEVHRLFEAACVLPPGQRTKYLQSQTADPEVQREVLSLLAHDALAAPFFADALESAASSVLLDLDLRPGTRMGSFTIVRMLGRGGMGAVYLAKRADGSFEQTVAIKVIQSPHPMPILLARFQQERQILARLNHPNIARLLDGGETPAGLPYLVMEYVPGQEIDTYCDKSALDLRARLRLFLHVSAAVQYAHENLVVHRDLKPGNILVGDDSEPKLLDFGIAKVLDPLSGPAASISTRVLTPEYASPEQVRGDAITTAADIYSLGAVLYRLLTGRPPHTVEHLSPLDAARRISEQDAPVATNVPTDVRAILQKALHTDPRHRYRSADEFSTDIQRYLDGKPVLAASDSVGYRTAKFLRRHWIPVLAISAIVLALTAGAGVAIWQGRRAQQRFAQVRTLANHFIFDFESAIRYTPGTIAARRLVLSTAREYLTSLEADTRNDPALNRELAQSYYLLGRAEASAAENGPAMDHLRHSLEMQKKLRDDCCGPSQARLAYLTTLTYLARYMEDSSNPEDALPLATQALSMARAWNMQAPRDPLAEKGLAFSLSAAGDVLRDRGQDKEAVKLLTEARPLWDAQLKQSPGDLELGLYAAQTQAWLADALNGSEGPARAVTASKEARAMLDALLVLHPTDTRVRYERIRVAGNMATYLRALAHRDPAYQPGSEQAAREAWTLARENARLSPGDNDALDQAAVDATILANRLVEQKKMKEAWPLYVESGELIDQLLKIDPSDRRNLYLKASNLSAKGSFLAEQNRITEQTPTLVEAETIFRRILKTWPGDLRSQNDLISALYIHADGERREGHIESARKICQEALDLAADAFRQQKDNLQPVWAIEDLRKEAAMLQLADPTLQIEKANRAGSSH